MGLLQRIKNGTTTEADALEVEALMSAKADKTYEIMRMRLSTKIMIALFLLGGVFLGLSIGGLFF